jgi:hypothetical protein
MGKSKASVVAVPGQASLATSEKGLGSGRQLQGEGAPASGMTRVISPLLGTLPVFVAFCHEQCLAADLEVHSICVVSNIDFQEGDNHASTNIFRE